MEGIFKEIQEYQGVLSELTLQEREWDEPMLISVRPLSKVEAAAWYAAEAEAEREYQERLAAPKGWKYKGDLYLQPWGNQDRLFLNGTEVSIPLDFWNREIDPDDPRYSFTRGNRYVWGRAEKIDLSEAQKQECLLLRAEVEKAEKAAALAAEAEAAAYAAAHPWSTLKKEYSTIAGVLLEKKQGKRCVYVCRPIWGIPQIEPPAEWQEIADQLPQRFFTEDVEEARKLMAEWAKKYARAKQIEREVKEDKYDLEQGSWPRHGWLKRPKPVPKRVQVGPIRPEKPILRPKKEPEKPILRKKR